MTTTTRKIIYFLILLPLLNACHQHKKTDLFSLGMNEPIDSLINFDDSVYIGVETAEYPYSLLLSVEDAKNYRFGEQNLKDQRIYFLVNSEVLKTDSITRFGGAHIDMVPQRNGQMLKKVLTNYRADNEIYGVRIEMNSQKLKESILKEIELKHGQGIKNPNTDNGLYWKVEDESKFIFYAPDYGRLIIINYRNNSEKCYWDNMNGFIDFGGCDKEAYFKELLKNSTKPEDVDNKPVITINKDWNINDFKLGKTNEEEFLRSKYSKDFESLKDLNSAEMIYQDRYHDIYFFFNDLENQSHNRLKGYSLGDFRKTKISFENGLKPGMTMDDAIKLFDRNIIKNYEGLSISDYIELVHPPYKITLQFGDSQLFSGMYVTQDD